MSSYTVIARKWRPQNFEAVVGQKTITQTLQNAIRSNRVAHAFIFSGARGVGKTTTARILARALNCRREPTPDPCGECVSCQEIAAGNSLDVLEIDAASNRGIDSIRELRETIKYRPGRDRFKIFIIDEVHMLTNEAFNALLKTLEEPPEHVKFIMATTEPHKIPATILSRTQQFEFKLIPYQQILDQLRLIAQSEGIEISDYALRLICSAGEGSMRDAQSALDQVLAFSGQQVRDEDVRSVLGVIAEDLLNAVIDALIRRDRKMLLDQIQQVARHGHDLQMFCKKLLEHFRHLLVIKAAGFQPDMISVSASQAEFLKQQVGNFSEMDLLRIYDLLSRAESELRWHPYPLFHLEITLLKVLQLQHLEEIEKLLSRQQTPSGGSSGQETNSPSLTRKPQVLEKQLSAAPDAEAGKPPSEEVETPPENLASREKTHRALKDPRVQLFTEAFPGKISIEDLGEG